MIWICKWSIARSRFLPTRHYPSRANLPHLDKIWLEPSILYYWTVQHALPTNLWLLITISFPSSLLFSSCSDLIIGTYQPTPPLWKITYPCRSTAA